MDLGIRGRVAVVAAQFNGCDPRSHFRPRLTLGAGRNSVLMNGPCSADDPAATADVLRW